MLTAEVAAEAAAAAVFGLNSGAAVVSLGAVEELWPAVVNLGTRSWD
jgi:hypothetical protein